MRATKPLVVAITGPTATGKTEAGVAVCLKLGGEVLSMDSMQIYQKLTIGTAKPGAMDMRGVPHHLLSYVEPDAAYSVAQYQQDALSSLNGVLHRGRLPVFVGGTGLYLQAVSHPLHFTNAGGESPARERLTQEAIEPGGPERLHRLLSQVDPKSAERLHVNNTRRVIRALEVFELTGAPMSEQINDWEAEPEQDFLLYALTAPRDELYRRIEARVDRMVAQGLIEEVEALLKGGVPRTAQALSAIGYKEIIETLDGRCTKAEAIDRIKMNSRRYAKRQLTWFRRDARIKWLNIRDFEDTQALHRELIQGIKRHMEERNDSE